MQEMLKSEDTKNKFPYLDILYLEHPTSKYHQRMSNLHRAEQFAPFAALTGFSEQIKETARITKDAINLTEEAKEKLDEQLQKIEIGQEIKIIYFIKDKRKKGGSFEEKIGNLKKIDTYQKQIVFEDKEKINIKDIVKIEKYR